MKNHLLFFCSFFAFSFSILFAQNGVDRGWQHFSENEYDEAYEAFSSELSGPNAADAHLGISLVGAAGGLSENGLSFKHYYDFYRKAENPQPYLLGLWSMNGGDRTDLEIEYLELLEEQETGTIQKLAQQALGYHYHAVGNHKKSAQYFEAIGALRDWAVLGEFDNVSESGFDKTFGALLRPKHNDVFTNKRGVSVQWFDLKAPRYDNWVDMEYYFYASDAIIYSQTFCNSPKEQEVQFRLGVSGSAKVWVNDHLLFSESHERNNNIDAYVFTAKLLQGNNRILIQLGESEANNCNFLLRITDDEGQNIPDLTYDTHYQDYDKSYQFNSERLPDPVAPFFEAKIAAEPDQINNYLILSQYYSHNDNLSAAKPILQQARERFPNSGYLIWQQINVYASDNNAPQTNALIEELKLKEPDGSLVLSILFDEASEREDIEEMENILDRIEQKEGESANVLEKKIQMSIEKGEREVMFDLIEAGYKLYPENYTFVYYKFLVEKDVNSNKRGAIRILKNYINDGHYSEGAIRELAGAYFSNNDLDNGLSKFEELIERNPIATGYYSQMASIYFNLGKYKKAEEYVQECIKIAPYVGSYHETLANSYAELGRKGDAQKSYEKAIYLDPYNYEARKQLRLLLDKPDIFDHFEEQDVYALYENAPDASEFPDDNSIILLLETQRVIYEGGGSEEKHTFVVKTFNSDGVDSWKEYQVPVYNNQDGNIEKAEVIKKNGNRLEAQKNGGYVVFPNLEEGDAIHITYRLQNYFSGKLAEHFWGTHYLESYLPISQSKMSLLVPEDKTFDFLCANSNIEPTISNIADGKLYSWAVADVPGIKYEPYMSELADVGAILHYSSFPDWNYISDWYSDLAQAKAKVDFEVEEVAKTLFDGKESASDREKAEIIYDYIVDNIRYRSVAFLQSGLVPQRASATISAKQGDCKDVSTLFVALCETQDIPANLVLINTRNNGQHEMMLPSIDFNHCIAKVNLEGSEHFLELTTENLPFGVNGPTTDQVFFLDIPIETDAQVNGSILAPGNYLKSVVDRKTSVTFDGDQMTLLRENSKSGNSAAYMRDVYENIGPDLQFKNMQEAINSEYPGIKLESVEFVSGLDNNADEVLYNYGFSVPSFFTEISGLRIFDIPYSSDLQNPDFVSTDTRKYPIQLWQYFRNDIHHETLEIGIPEGQTLSEMPENMLVENANLKYEVTYGVADGVLTVVRHFEVKDDMVMPEKFEAFKADIEKIVKEDARKLAFKE